MLLSNFPTVNTYYSKGSCKKVIFREDPVILQMGVVVILPLLICLPVTSGDSYRTGHLTGGPQSVGKRSALIVRLSPTIACIQIAAHRRPVADQSLTVLRQVFAIPPICTDCCPLVGDWLATEVGDWSTTGCGQLVIANC